MLDKTSGTMVLAGAGKSTWVMPNANASGYYRFSLDKQALGSLVGQVGKLSDAEQLAYADAVNASFQHGELDAGDVLTALQPLTASKTREVATAPLDQIQWIYQNIASTDAQRARLADWIKAAYLPRLQQLGYQRKAGESESDSLLRSTLAGSLALDFKLPEARAALLKQGEAALKPGADGHLNLAAADPDLLGDALGVAVQQHGKSAVDALMAELPKTSDPALRNGMLEGMAVAQDRPKMPSECRQQMIQLCRGAEGGFGQCLRTALPKLSDECRKAMSDRAMARQKTPDGMTEIAYGSDPKQRMDLAVPSSGGIG